MNKFGYGMAFNLTLVENALPKELEFLGINNAKKNKIMGGTYIVKQDSTLSGDNAKHSHYVIKQPDQKTIKDEVYLYSPDLNKSTLETNIQLAGHEIIHSTNYDSKFTKMDFLSPTPLRDTYTAKEVVKKNGFTAAFGAYVGLMRYIGNDGLGLAALKGGLVIAAGVAVKYGLKNLVAYNDELKSYHYDAKLAAILNKSKGHIPSLDAQLKDKKDKISLKDSFSDRFVSGYPGIETREAILIEEKLNFVREGADSLFTPKRIGELHDKTNQNINKGRFKLYERKPS